MIKCHFVGSSAWRGLTHPSPCLTHSLSSWVEVHKRLLKTRNVPGSKVTTCRREPLRGHVNKTTTIKHHFRHHALIYPLIWLWIRIYMKVVISTGVSVTHQSTYRHYLLIQFNTNSLSYVCFSYFYLFFPVSHNRGFYMSP